MRLSTAPADFTGVTEVPGTGATREQVSMLYTRYRLAGDVAREKDVLEVACGAGIGLGYLAERSRRLVAGDRDEGLLRRAYTGPRQAVHLLRFDAHHLPFRDRTFDVVILFEALYYLAEPDQFVAEVRRVLRPAGILLICSANRRVPGFVPSLYAVRYFSAPELRRLLEDSGFSVQMYGGHPVARSSRWDRAILAVRRLASTLHLIPPTLRARGILKRMAYGRLEPIPSEIFDGMAEPSELIPLSGGGDTSDCKVLFAEARLP